jgi:hypothetical protein
MSTKNTKDNRISNQLSEDLLDEIDFKLEENEFFNYLYEQGIDAEKLTEEELDELFGFGMDRQTSRDAARDSRMASKERRRKRGIQSDAQSSRQRRRQAMKDRVASLSKKKPEGPYRGSNFTDEDYKKLGETPPVAKAPTLKKTPTPKETPTPRGRFNPTTGRGGDNMIRPSVRAKRLKSRQGTAKAKAASKLYNPSMAGGTSSNTIAASTDLVRGARLALAEACWKGYKARGLKKKSGKLVPNCVKENNKNLSVNDQLDQMDADRAARQAKVKKMKEPGGPLSTHPKDMTPRGADGTPKTYKTQSPSTKTQSPSTKTQNSSTELVRNSRIALAERVLSEITRSEEHRLSKGGVTTNAIKAERAKRRKTDPKAQRYRARGVTRSRGKEDDNPAAGHIRRLAGQKAETKRQNKKYADARAAGNVTKVVTASDSTEIIKKGRMALAERVLEARLGKAPVDTKNPKNRVKLMKKGAKAVKSRADNVVNKAAAPKEEEPQPTVKATKHSSEGPLGYSRSNTLDHTMAAHRTRSGEPVPNPRSTKSSTTAHGGKAGSEENKVNRATPDEINRSRSDNPGEVFKRAGKQKPKEPAAFGTSKRAVNRAKKKAAKKKVSNYADEVVSDLTPKDY